ncbi:NAD-dependent epimerase/dehydratase family protein [Opitutus sp. GAS368]|uniref:NAD-dependent epimerase/dehydratase family protein n=1 Tax=Opitutus sp. GAS368 TaxID=1882749 RepID=UPI00087C1649|nr:NAD-dependent epimerase/dehydratase family protein [Opitutus sp. GAS368]SDS26445.1 NADH dehydrogenase [Opitutus sp. GAS368]
MKLRVAITGANGMLGAALARRLLAAGAGVQALARRAPNLAGAEWKTYDLAGPGTANLENIDVVVHAAFAQGAAGPALQELNRSAAQRLLAAARKQGAHFIFISSMSAHADAASSYGRAKWAIEQMLDPAGDTIVRPGLIVGPGGTYARMLAALRRAPVVPVFYGGTQPVQPAGLDDVVRGLERLATGRLAGVFNLGAPEPITVRELYARMLAATGLRRAIVPLPGDFTVALLRVGERLGLHLPVTVENLLGQKCLRAFDTSASFIRLGLTPAPLDDLNWSIPSPPP